MVHWSSPDPAAFDGTGEEQRKFFVQVATQIQRRIDLLCCLPFEKLNALSLEAATLEMGQREKINTTVPTYDQA